MIIPSINLRGGVVVRQEGGKEVALDDDPLILVETLSILGHIAVYDLDAFHGRSDNKQLILNFINTGASVHLGGIHDQETAFFWLNQGVATVILDHATEPEIFSTLPKSRVIAALNVENDTDAKVHVASKKQYVSGFAVTFSNAVGVDIEVAKQVAEIIGQGSNLTILGREETTIEEIVAADKLGIIQIPSTLLKGKLDLGLVVAATLISDRADGLFPTVVVDEQGTALGLVYSSTESIKEAVRLRRGVYFSRSRKSLWYKGDTSGDTQKLIRIEIDCDKDALRFVVAQEGDGFCHLKSRSCFSAKDTGLPALMRTLESRKTNAPAGSYTKRLFEDDNLLRAKLVEEANELADAKTKKDICFEAADVIYFALVAAAKSGVSLADIERELDRRSLKVQRRTGDAKPHIVSQLQQQDQQKIQKQQEQKQDQPSPQPLIVSPEKPLHIASSQSSNKPIVKLALPKGRMEAGIFKLFNDAGLSLQVAARGYRPTVAVPGFDVKLLKPQNIVEMVNIGNRDIGFTGADLVEELGVKGLTVILDTKLDKVRLVAAAPEDILTADGEVIPSVTESRKLVVASEYKNITQRWMAKRGLTQENSVYVLSRGATEVFPPEDADIIVDNTATGSTLKANRLRPFDELLHSTTCMYVNTALWQATDEESAAKRRVIETLVTLLKSVLDARQKVILEFNVEKDKLETVCKFIPAMREPTISQLHGSQGFAVKSAVPREELFNLIPLIKAHGGSDIIVTELHHVVL